MQIESQLVLMLFPPLPSLSGREILLCEESWELSSFTGIPASIIVPLVSWTRTSVERCARLLASLVMGAVDLICLAAHSIPALYDRLVVVTTVKRLQATLARRERTSTLESQIASKLERLLPR